MTARNCAGASDAVRQQQGRTKHADDTGLEPRSADADFETEILRERLDQDVRAADEPNESQPPGEPEAEHERRSGCPDEQHERAEVDVRRRRRRSRDRSRRLNGRRERRDRTRDVLDQRAPFETVRRRGRG
jgi:hypothetical protein